jgi:hypothetical protein
MMAQIASSLLPSGLSHIHPWECGPRLFGLLAVATGKSQVPALSRAAFSFEEQRLARGDAFGIDYGL